MRGRNGFTFIEVMLAVVLVGAIGGALLMGMYNANAGQQSASSKQAAAFLFDYLATQVTNGNPRYTPPNNGDTITLSPADVSAAFAGQTGATLANAQLFNARVTNVRNLTETIAGTAVNSVEYLISVCWEPVSQATGATEQACVEKTVTGPVPSRYAGGSSVTPSESIPVGSGKLVINITAPTGVAGNVLVTGPGFNQTVTASTVLEGLAPGDYTITPQPVSDSLYTYEPSMTTSSTPIGAGEGVVVNVTYTATSGALSISVAYPAGVPSPSIVVSSTDPPYSVVVNDTTTLPYLSPGTYTINAQPITSGPYTYAPTVSDASVVIVAGSTASTTVSYGATTGALETTVAAPAAVNSATVRIVGPNNYQSTVGLGTSLLDNLLEGTYLAVPEDVVVDGVTYSGTVSPTTGAYVAPGSTASLQVDYAPIDAALTVNVVPEATPANIDPVVRVAAPDGTVQTLRGLSSHALPGLAPGTYTISADPASDGTFTWEPSPSSTTATLTAGQSQAVEIRYAIRSGVVQLYVSGLPSGAGTPITLRAPNQTYTFGQGVHEVNPAEPGTYDLAADPVVSGPFSYAPSPASDQFQVAAGAVVTKQITYAADTGALELASTGLPAGLSAQYSVSGPSSAGSYTGDQTLPQLIPGTYTVGASEVSDGYATYTPSPPSADVAVSAGASSTASFSYTLLPAALNVDVTAPTGSTPSVTLSGPSGPYTVSAPGTTGFSNVTPGVYTVTADPIVVDYRRYVPSYPASVEVFSGQTANVPVVYAPTTAAIEVTVTDPVGQASITVTGPNGYSRTITASTILDGLEAGTYNLTPASYTAGGDRYEAASVQVTVNLGDYAFANVEYRRVTANLNVPITGLPAGVGADVTVTGPGGYSQTLSATTLLKGLEPGTYTVSAAPVSANGYTYSPTPATANIALASGADGEVAIAYAPTSGVIRLEAVAPDGLSYDVQIAGPGATLSYSGTGSQSTVFPDQPLGDYAATASTATLGLISYAPSITPATFTLAGAQTQTVTVRYAPSTAALQVNIGGLPNGLNAAVTITGPNGYRRLLNASAVLDGLEPGTYVMTAGPVFSGSARYDASPSNTSLTLAAGDVGTFDVTYTLVPASLRLTVDGLPTGATPTITLTGPNGFTSTVNGSYTWTALEPGPYTLTAGDVVVTPFTYTPSPPTVDLTLESGNTATATITYGTDRGQLLINVAGYTSAPYRVTGPGGYDQTFTGSQDLLLSPGTYTITAPDYQAPDGHTYRSTQPSLSVSVTAGQTATASFEFYRYTATVTTAATGLPADAVSTYTLSGSSYTVPTVHILLPGSYTFQPDPVVVGNLEYRAAPVTIDAQPGADYPATFAYAQYTAVLNVTVTGAPAGTTPTVRVYNDTTSQTLTGTSLTFYLPPGTYTVEGLDVTSGNFTYRSSSTTVSLAPGATQAASVTYSKYTATLNVSVTGAPTSPTITVSGGGTSSSKVGTALTFYLPPGSYTVAGNRLASNGFYYEAAPKIVTLPTGGTIFTTLAYTVRTGKALVYNTGSRSGYPAITLTGPNGYSSSIPAGSNPAYRNYLYPGTYALSYTSPYYLNTARRFVARNAINSASVSAGGTATLKVYWQYQEWTCTARFIVCLSWGWVDK
ncbi:hypothetical protein [Oceanithermus sp.]|uniref:hypothetical protein n=1 Tax=Oceanithermus sp. TaxID=2268145 RepID=UPI00257EE1DA|nr:hypothetical protein [Oceanithermus sp.]